ncbi:hypothetical protein DPMN_091461 [Dreissena polymorpha]|uniref:Uncharacterized protein n=1 Tax=Dreissena polymorpha TaxID=45954 RepID=A0A9D4L1M8_DREPO|nr:hypothetical protein DPMN_091461 [Dreissena polymorpha]
MPDEACPLLTGQVLYHPLTGLLASVYQLIYHYHPLLQVFPTNRAVIVIDSRQNNVSAFYACMQIGPCGS